MILSSREAQDPSAQPPAWPSQAGTAHTWIPTLSLPTNSSMTKLLLAPALHLMLLVMSER